jgi:hypothetical protein
LGTSRAWEGSKESFYNLKFADVPRGASLWDTDFLGSTIVEKEANLVFFPLISFFMGSPGGRERMRKWYKGWSSKARLGSTCSDQSIDTVPHGLLQAAQEVPLVWC